MRDRAAPYLLLAFLTLASPCAPLGRCSTVIKTVGVEPGSFCGHMFVSKPCEDNSCASATAASRLGLSPVLPTKTPVRGGAEVGAYNLEIPCGSGTFHLANRSVATISKVNVLASESVMLYERLASCGENELSCDTISNWSFLLNSRHAYVSSILRRANFSFSRFPSVIRFCFLSSATSCSALAARPCCFASSVLASVKSLSNVRNLSTWKSFTRLPKYQNPNPAANVNPNNTTPNPSKIDFQNSADSGDINRTAERFVTLSVFVVCIFGFSSCMITAAFLVRDLWRKTH